MLSISLVYIVLMSSLFASSTLGHKMSPWGKGGTLPPFFQLCFFLVWSLFALRPHCFLKTFSLSNSLSKRECSLIEVVFIRFPLCWCLNPSHPFRYCSLAEPHICKGLDKLIPGLFLFANFFSQIHIGPAQLAPTGWPSSLKSDFPPGSGWLKMWKPWKTDLFAA